MHLSGGDTKPELLLAVVSSVPLTSLKFEKAAAAEALFPLVLAEAARSGQTIGVAAKYLKLEK
jgi:hypothetical protein